MADGGLAPSMDEDWGLGEPVADWAVVSSAGKLLVLLPFGESDMKGVSDMLKLMGLLLLLVLLVLLRCALVPAFCVVEYQSLRSPRHVRVCDCAPPLLPFLVR